jgi:hypothetical protein
MIGGPAVVRANIRGVFPTYKTLKDGTRRTYWYHRATGSRLHGEPTLLSESGSTPQQIAPITGHSLKTVHRILEHYLARTSGLAEQAIFNWENSERTKFANQLQTGTAAEIGPKGKSHAR